jgi:hypothetical protein
MKIEAVASLKLWAVTVSIGGSSYRIRPRPAADWLHAIASPSLARIVPGLFDDAEAGEDLMDALLDGIVTVDEWQRAAHDAISAISGLKWWTATRLTHYLLEHWGTLGGTVLSKGMDPARAPLGAVLTLTYRMLLENCKGEPERQRVDRELDKPPSGVAVAEIFDPQQAAANFMALAGAAS